MAQHIPIQSFKQKRFRDIENSIRNKFERSRFGVKYSMKFNYDPSLSKFLRESEDWEVYSTERKIPKGIVWGSEQGHFEIHKNIKTKELKIFLVA